MAAGFDLLPGRRVALALLVAQLPAPLATLPAPPPLPTPRRLLPWAVQVLAGPTVSYRRGTSQPASSSSYRPDYSAYERPALGWGAQAQLQRPLGRHWTLAAGLGYHEYATRLALDVTTYHRDSSQLASSYSVATTAVRQRDTYRLLTLPVQLDYVLPSRRAWQLGLVAGAEPGLYLGGRTTEGSDCACQQQSFSLSNSSQASSSPSTSYQHSTSYPYHSLSVALSLALEVRYRLGGPAGRWQLLVQPAGRYVATPFVRDDASSIYLRRQPYSFGLMTGLAWTW